MTNNWTGVTRSPNKKQPPVFQMQIIPSTVIRVSNYFDALSCEDEDAVMESEIEKKQLDDATRPITESNGYPQSEKKQENTKDISARLEIVTVNDHTTDITQSPATATPTIQISNPELAKMVQAAQAAMLQNTIIMIKELLVTLNTSVFEVPSQTMGSFGEYADESG